MIWSASGFIKWGGLQNSRSIWSSAIAAVAISLERIATAKKAAENWLEDHPGGAVVMAVVTLAHDRDQRLRYLMDTLARCHSAAFSRGGWATDKKRYDLAAWHKQVECTVGPNGWHPHNNVLLFVEKALTPTELEALEGRLFERHAREAVKHGLKSPNRERGVRLFQATDLEEATVMAAYASKGPAEALVGEATGGTFKEAKNGHMTQWQLLDDIGRARRSGGRAEQSVARWREWEKATLGRRQSSWSKGAKELLRVEVLEDDQVESTDLLEALDVDGDQTRYVVATVDADDWDGKLSDDVGRRLDVVEYLKAAQIKDPEEARKKAAAILDTLGIVHESLCLELDSGPAPWAHRVRAEESRAVLE